MPNGPRFRYIGPDTRMPADSLESMYNQAKGLSYRRFIRLVSAEQLKKLFPHHAWAPRLPGLKLQHDWAARFYSSKLDGKPCLYVEYQDKRFIFAPN